MPLWGADLGLRSGVIPASGDLARAIDPAALASCRGPVFGTGFQPSVIKWMGSTQTAPLASPAFGGCSFLLDGHAERHSAVQRIPRSHSSASLRSRSALALFCSARASLRYRIARALLMGISNPNATEQGFRLCQQRRPGAFRKARPPVLTRRGQGKPTSLGYREPTPP
jgi:hypothetical protein